MKPNPEAQDKESLDKLMQEWRVDTPLPPRFQEHVWSRIAQADARPVASLWTRLLNLVEVALPRPSVASSYVAILLLVGVLAGSWAAQRQTAQMDAALGSRYIQSMDPYQRPALNP